MKKLLIVDDDAPTRRLLVATFQHEYVVLEAADGISALLIVMDQLPDLVILDGKLPRLDGLAVLAAIKIEPKTAHVLVMMMTGRGQFSDLEKGMELGADAYFIKPVSPATLRAWALERLAPGNKSPTHPEETATSP
jgi:DNA-binding response OmpR family regulator